jgi:tetratricopeptide (TPR) repeat protein
MNQNNLEKAKKYFNNGLQYFNAKDYIKAETEFLESLKFYPNRISVIINILQIYLLTENLIKIEIYFVFQT